MLRTKLLWTLFLEVVYVAISVPADYLINVVVNHDGAAFTPYLTAGITLFVGGPATFYLINQRFNLKRAIGEGKALAASLEQALKDAEVATRAKSDFLANMTHELRTPLNAVVGFSGVLRDSQDLTATDRRHVERIAAASAALLHVVNDVLDLSRFDAAAIELEANPFDPFEVVAAAVAILERQAADKGIEITLRREGEALRLLGDAHRLRQVLLNLLSNAVKFTVKGEVAVLVRQTATAPRGTLRVEVADSGIGVSEAQAAKIFDRFAQADTSVSRQFGGTGLGLAISKQIIDLFGGRIGVESAPGQGSTFWFELSLPLALQEDAEAEDAPAPPAGRAVKLLLAEDNAVNRELVHALLAPFGVEIVEAVDGVEAVQAAARDHFDLILMDVHMPTMDGLTAMRLIRSATPPGAARTPIIAMTANVLPEQVARCLEAGADDHVGKPVRLPVLLEAMRRWTEAAPGETPPH